MSRDKLPFFSVGQEVADRRYPDRRLVFQHWTKYGKSTIATVKCMETRRVIGIAARFIVSRMIVRREETANAERNRIRGILRRRVTEEIAAKIGLTREQILEVV